MKHYATIPLFLLQIPYSHPTYVTSAFKLSPCVLLLIIINLDFDKGTDVS